MEDNLLTVVLKYDSEEDSGLKSIVNSFSKKEKINDCDIIAVSRFNEMSDGDDHDDDIFLTFVLNDKSNNRRGLKSIFELFLNKEKMFNGDIIALSRKNEISK